MAAAYPQVAGWKAEGTSREAAEAISASSRSSTLCDKTLALLKRQPMTPEEVAVQLGEPVFSIRPRFSQLHARELIEKTTERRRAMGGRMASVWRAR